MKYKVCIEMLNIVEVDAISEDDAIKKVKSSLIMQKQIKETDPVTFSVAREIILENVKDEKE
jgi:hypothetical protein